MTVSIACMVSAKTFSCATDVKLQRAEVTIPPCCHSVVKIWSFLNQEMEDESPQYSDLTKFYFCCFRVGTVLCRVSYSSQK